MSPLWPKALHLIFMVTWFAGLFYLPRLFIYHAGVTDTESDQRFQTMERRLFSIMTIGALLTLVFGILTLLQPAYSASLGALWFQVKLVLVAGLVAYHLSCLRWMRRLKDGFRPESTRGLRWFNEIPVFFLGAIVILAVVRPL